ncbi:MAG: Ig-like domain-containing protein, partial [Ginsengibacter sp.]
MNIRNTSIFIALCCIMYVLSILGSGCAQIVAPTGGPRDSIPPVLVNATPPNGTVNFKGNRITLTYDEYVQLDTKLQQTLLVAPTPKINPNITFKFKTITIKIRDTLQPNTTYRIDLGNSVEDFTEGNPVKNFSYIFSTGPYIDSLEFSGNVELAQTGKIDTTLLVFLYNNLDDSAVLKQKPRYVTRVNTKGDFKFHNLPGGTYHVFSLQDESGQKVYNNKDELFA